MCIHINNNKKYIYKQCGNENQNITKGCTILWNMD